MDENSLWMVFVLTIFQLNQTSSLRFSIVYFSSLSFLGASLKMEVESCMSL